MVRKQYIEEASNYGREVGIEMLTRMIQSVRSEASSVSHLETLMLNVANASIKAYDALHSEKTKSAMSFIELTEMSVEDNVSAADRYSSPMDLDADPKGPRLNGNIAFAFKDIPGPTMNYLSFREMFPYLNLSNADNKIMEGSQYFFFDVMIYLSDFPIMHRNYLKLNEKRISLENREDRVQTLAKSISKKMKGYKDAENKLRKAHDELEKAKKKERIAALNMARIKSKALREAEKRIPFDFKGIKKLEDFIR